MTEQTEAQRQALEVVRREWEAFQKRYPGLRSDYEAVEDAAAAHIAAETKKGTPPSKIIEGLVEGTAAGMGHRSMADQLADRARKLWGDDR